jgi:hypothetical protein
MSDPSELFVKRAGADDTALVGEILGDAFGADPVSRWITPNPEYPLLPVRHRRAFRFKRKRHRFGPA